MFLPRFIFVMALLPLSGAMAQAAEPLYQQFRPLSSLPWTAPDATWESVIRRIYLDPIEDIRAAVLEEYLKQVPAERFPEVFDLCIHLEEDDSPDELLERLMYAWARKDPAAAWAKCLELYEIVVPQEPLDVDGWEKVILVANPQAVAASTFWPPSAAFATGFYRGVKESTLPATEKDRITAALISRSAALGKASKSTWIGSFDIGPEGPETADPQPERTSEEQRAEERRRFLLEILACPPAEVESRLAQAPPVVWQDEFLLARALIRWMDGKASRGFQIFDFVMDTADPHAVMRFTSQKEPIPLEFLAEWALLDFDNLLNWANAVPSGRPGAYVKSEAVLTTFAWRLGVARQDEMTDPSDDSEDPDTILELLTQWAQLDPEVALPFIYSHGAVRTYGELAPDAMHWRWSSNVKRSYIRRLEEGPIPLPGQQLSYLMETWTHIDAAATARHGVGWCLRTKYFTQKRLAQVWSGNGSPFDGSVDDRLYGSLRVWAMRRPEEMRAWIRAEPLPEDVRTALLWLVDHAKGGFQPHEDTQPPIAPAQP